MAQYESKQSRTARNIEQSIIQAKNGFLSTDSSLQAIANSNDILFVNKFWCEKKHIFLGSILVFLGLIVLSVLFKYAGLTLGVIPVVIIYAIMTDSMKIVYTLVIMRNEILLVPSSKKHNVISLKVDNINSINLNTPMNRIVICYYSEVGHLDKLTLITNYFNVVKETGYILMRTEFVDQVKQRDRLLRKYGFGS